MIQIDILRIFFRNYTEKYGSVFTVYTLGEYTFIDDE